MSGIGLWLYESGPLWYWDLRSWLCHKGIRCPRCKEDHRHIRRLR